ncbi:concanavalin A-like lectin/glucanase domain-containing protein [Apiospora hydei]|uniref:Concanavalin A-like lectin/glucanase domain-containing protein n=1 Tax=Apiospora hydei TaxID=1337664 RepID=A0ABR1V621_9PEZI
MSRNGQKTRPPSQLPDRKELGYQPFEYWKGPKRILPKEAQPIGTTVIRLPNHSGYTSTAQQHKSAGTVVHTHSYPIEKVRPATSLHPALSNQNTNMGWEQHNGQAGPTSFQVRDANGRVEFVNEPPSYDNQELPPRTNNMSRYVGVQPWYKRKRTWIISAVVLIVAIIVAVVAGVLVSKANRYPDYTKLNYSLQDTYSGETFFDQFDYFTGFDPAQGFVHYVPKEQAQQFCNSANPANQNLTHATAQSAVMKVDTSVGPGSNPDASTGRFSVRVSSKKQYNSGLFIFDVKHTPFGCGTWPALWLVDENEWPKSGEIDIMEAVNKADKGNQMTLHTTDGCDMSVKRKMTGTTLQNDCFNETNSNAGCGVQGNDASYGATYNAAGGGIMAMEWRNEGIRMWQFGRSSIPADITSKKPDPSTWGVAAADFPNTGCSMDTHFRNQSIIANIDLCGQLTNAVYAESGCPSNCTDFVANNPQAFKDAFWEFGAFDVYKAS